MARQDDTLYAFVNIFRTSFELICCPSLDLAGEKNQVKTMDSLKGSTEDVDKTVSDLEIIFCLLMFQQKRTFFQNWSEKFQ